MKYEKAIYAAILLFALSACNLGASADGNGNQPEAVVFVSDDFSSPVNDWVVQQNEGVKGYHDGVYRIRVPYDNYYSWSVAKKNLTDVVIEADVEFVTGELSEVGLVCRWQDDWNLYFFTIRSDGQFGMLKMVNHDVVHLAGAGYQNSLAIYSEGVNHLKVECVGSAFTLYVNGTLLATVVDVTFRMGDIGMMVGSFDIPGAEAYFDNFLALMP